MISKKEFVIKNSPMILASLAAKSSDLGGTARSAMQVAGVLWENIKSEYPDEPKTKDDEAVEEPSCSCYRCTTGDHTGTCPNAKFVICVGTEYLCGDNDLTSEMRKARIYTDQKEAETKAKIIKGIVEPL